MISKRLTDEELEELIVELESSGFYRRQLISPGELQATAAPSIRTPPVLKLVFSAGGVEQRATRGVRYIHIRTEKN